MHSLYSESGLSVSLHIELSPSFAECLQYLFANGQYNLLFGISSFYFDSDQLFDGLYVHKRSPNNIYSFRQQNYKFYLVDTPRSIRIKYKITKGLITKRIPKIIRLIIRHAPLVNIERGCVLTHPHSCLYLPS